MARPAYEVVKTLKRDAENYKGDSADVHHGIVTGTLNKYLNGDNNRYLLLGYVFGYKHKAEGGDGVLKPMSSKQLTDGQWFALKRWISTEYNEETGKWDISEDFIAEALAVLNEAIITNGVAGIYKDQPELVEEMLKLDGKIVALVPDKPLKSRFGRATKNKK